LFSKKRHPNPEEISTLFCIKNIFFYIFVINFHGIFFNEKYNYLNLFIIFISCFPCELFGLA